MHNEIHQMIDEKDIYRLYKLYPTPLDKINESDVGILLNDNLSQHEIRVVGDSIVIGSVDEQNPLHDVPVRNVSGITEIANYVVIVLRNSIVFLDKNTNDVRMHIRMCKLSLFERLKYLFRRKK